MCGAVNSNFGIIWNTHRVKNTSGTLARGRLLERWIRIHPSTTHSDITNETSLIQTTVLHLYRLLSRIGILVHPEFVDCSLLHIHDVEHAVKLGVQYP